MISKTVLITALIAYAEARFGQEQVPISAISEVQGGEPGAAATIAGAAISDLLGAANACDKLATADQIVADLGGGADAIAAAIGMVTAEKNTNPFANDNVQNVCADATLPATAELRGITPLIDPAVDVDGLVAQLSADSAADPLDAEGLSVFDLLVNAGLGDLVAAQDAAGGAGNGGAAGNDQADDQNQGAADDQDQAAADDQDQAAADDEDQAAADDEEEEEAAACDAGNANNGNATAGNDQADAGNDNQADAGNDNQADAGNDNQNQGNAGNDQADAGNDAAAGGDAAGGADFGLCTPTIIFEGGLGGRPADEFTFQIADELARGGQQEALNPTIIVNALCNQLTNVCEANDAAITVCEAAAANVDANQRNKATADQFNADIGFPGAVTNPSGGPDDVAAKRMMRRGLRLRY